MRTSQFKLNASLKNQIEKTLAQTVADIKNLQESEIFLKDFFTDAELETFSKRLAIAYWLKKGRIYTNIKQNLKVSSATIAYVSEQMSKKGFVLALKKIEADKAIKWVQEQLSIMSACSPVLVHWLQNAQIFTWRILE